MEFVKKLLRTIYGCAKHTNHHEQVTNTDTQSFPAILFVQNIIQGEFSDDVLSIETAPQVLFFSDRPNRMAGHVSTDFLLDLWNKGEDSFKQNPPNAALSITHKEEIRNVVVELLPPSINKGRLNYPVKLISGELPSSFENASLFIDAFPTAVNSQVTDAVTQTNVRVLGDAPAVAMGNLFIATSQALSNAAHNATTSQQQTNITAQAATTQGVATLYSVDTASTGVASSKIYS